MKDCNEACTLCIAKLATEEYIFYWLITRLNSGKGERGKVHFFQFFSRCIAKDTSVNGLGLVANIFSLITIMSFSKSLLQFV